VKPNIRLIVGRIEISSSRTKENGTCFLTEEVLLIDLANNPPAARRSASDLMAKITGRAFSWDSADAPFRLAQ
jgi:hypothetical protein